MTTVRLRSQAALRRNLYIYAPLYSFGPRFSTTHSLDATALSGRTVTASRRRPPEIHASRTSRACGWSARETPHEPAFARSTPEPGTACGTRYPAHARPPVRRSWLDTHVLSVRRSEPGSFQLTES